MRRSCFHAVGAVWLVLVSCLVTVSSPAFASEPTEIARGNTPAWLVAREVPETTDALAARSVNGIIWLMTDWQVRAAQGGHTSYFRTVMRVKDRSGLEAAGTLQIEFDPHNEKVTLNHLRVIRDGRVIDHTNSLKMDILQRENDLEKGLLYGHATAIAHITDVRIGDIIDYATTFQVTDNLWPGHFFNTMSARPSTPLGLRAIRVAWPADRPFTFKPVNTDAALTQKKNGTDIVYELVQREPAVGSEENNIPDWIPANGVISTSTMSSWHEVARWATPLYQGDESLPDDFAAKIDRIAANWSKPEDRLTEATRLIQDTIRYVGVEVAEGSFVPRRPREVVIVGYGDCKDKSLLLVVMLRRLGIDAVPALVATSWGRALDGWAPSPAIFNHVIVRVQLGDKPIWIDPTLTHQGGRGREMTTPDYGYVLPIRAEQHDLERMEPAATAEDQQYVVERYEIDEAAETAMRLTVETLYRRGRADWMRGKLAVDPVSEIAKGNLNYYLADYPGIAEADPLLIKDDRDANVIRMVETYTLARADFEKAKLPERFPVRAYALQGLLPGKQNTPRQNPLYVSEDERRTHVIELAAKGRALGRLPDIDESAEGVQFKRKTVVDGELQRLTYTLSTGRNVVPAASAGSLYALSEKLDDETGLEFYLNKSGKSLEAALGIDPQEIAPFEERIRKVGELLQKESQDSKVEALTLLNTMSNEVKRPSAIAGLIDGFKGVALVTLNRLPAAQSALESSMGQYQGNFEMLKLAAGLQLQAQKPIDTVRTLAIVAKRYPGQIGAFNDNFVRSLRGMLFRDKSEAADAASKDLAILLAQAGWQQSPMTASGNAMRTIAVRHLLERGAVADARKLFAIAPVSSEAAAALAVDKRYSALWPELAEATRDNFRSLIAQDVVRSREALSKSPNDPKLLTQHVQDLRRAGQPEQAVAVAKDAVAARDRIEAAGSDGFWLVNEYAYALFDAGRRDDAFAQLDWLLGLNIEQYPDLISQAINRAEMLNAADKPAAALDALSALDGGPPDRASTYGKMWIWAGTVCAADTLRKAEIGGQAMRKLEEVVDDNPAAMTMALACRSDMDRLEALLIKRLDDPKQRQGALGGFSTMTLDKPRSDFEQKLKLVLDKVRSRPAVQAKFREYGRAVQFDGRATYWGGF